MSWGESEKFVWNDLKAGTIVLGKQMWCRKDHADLHLAVTVKLTSPVTVNMGATPLNMLRRLQISHEKRLHYTREVAAVCCPS